MGMISTRSSPHLGTRRAFLVAAVGGFFGWGRIGSVRAAHDADNRFAIVVSRAFPLSDISFPELRSVFLQERNAIGQHRVLPLNQPTGTRSRVAFDRIVLGLAPDAMARYWIDRRIRGLSGAPKSIAPELIVRVVARLSGSLAYVPVSQLDTSVKTLTVDGKSPNNPSYPLRMRA